MATLPKSFVPDTPALPKSFIADTPEDDTAPDTPDQEFGPNHVSRNSVGQQVYNDGKQWKDVFTGKPAQGPAAPQPIIPGMEKLGALPGVPAPPNPILNPSSDAPEFVKMAYEAKYGKPPETLGTAFREPVQQITGGAGHIAGAKSGKDVASGARQILSGASQVMMSPEVMGPAVAASPVGTAVSLGGGWAVQKGTEKGLTAAGVPEEYAGLAGDVAGLLAVGGGAAALARRAYLKAGSPEVKIGGKFEEPKPFSEMSDAELIAHRNTIEREPPKNYEWQRDQIAQEVAKRQVERGITEEVPPPPEGFVPVKAEAPPPPGGFIPVDESPIQGGPLSKVRMPRSFVKDAPTEAPAPPVSIEKPVETPTSGQEVAPVVEPPAQVSPAVPSVQAGTAPSPQPAVPAPSTAPDKSAPYFAKAEKLEKEAAHGEEIGGSPKTIAALRAQAAAFREKGTEVKARSQQQIAPPEVPSILAAAPPSGGLPSPQEGVAQEQKPNRPPEVEAAISTLPESIRRHVDVQRVVRGDFSAEHEGTGGRYEPRDKTIYIERGETDPNVVLHEALHSVTRNLNDSTDLLKDYVGARYAPTVAPELSAKVDQGSGFGYAYSGEEDFTKDLQRFVESPEKLKPEVRAVFEKHFGVAAAKPSFAEALVENVKSDHQRIIRHNETAKYPSPVDPLNGTPEGHVEGVMFRLRQDARTTQQGSHYLDAARILGAKVEPAPPSKTEQDDWRIGNPALEGWHQSTNYSITLPNGANWRVKWQPARWSKDPQNEGRWSTVKMAKQPPAEAPTPAPVEAKPPDGGAQPTPKEVAPAETPAQKLKAAAAKNVLKAAERKAKLKPAKRGRGIEPTYELAHAAGTDAGNRSMKRGGRTAWSQEDRNAAVDAFEKVLPQSKYTPPELEPDGPLQSKPIEGPAYRPGMSRSAKVTESQVIPARAGRERYPVLHVNAQAMNVLHEAAGMEDGHEIPGVTFTTPQAEELMRTINTELRKARLRNKPAEVAKWEEIRSAIEQNRAMAKGRPLIAVQNGVDITPEEHATALQEELDHAAQLEATGDIYAHHLGPEGTKRFLGTPEGSKASSTLRRTYPEVSDSQAVLEIGARLMRPGRFTELGLSPEEAQNLRDAYLSTLIERHGVERTVRISQKISAAQRTENRLQYGYERQTNVSARRGASGTEPEATGGASHVGRRVGNEEVQRLPERRSADASSDKASSRSDVSEGGGADRRGLQNAREGEAPGQVKSGGMKPARTEATAEYVAGPIVSSQRYMGAETVKNVEPDKFFVPYTNPAAKPGAGMKFSLAETEGTNGARRFNAYRESARDIEHYPPDASALVRDGKIESVFVRPDWRGAGLFGQFMRDLAARGLTVAEDSPKSASYLAAEAKQQKPLQSRKPKDEGPAIADLSGLTESIRARGQVSGAARRTAGTPARAKVTGALDNLKSATAAIFEAYKTPRSSILLPAGKDVSDYERALGKWSGDDNRSAHDLRLFRIDAEKAVPDKAVREAITNWIEAGGDDATLAKWAAESLQPYAKGYEDARHLTDEQKAIARDIKAHDAETLREIKKAGIVEQGVENYATHIYKNDPALVAKVRAQVNFDSLRTNPYFVKERDFPNYFDAEKAGLTPRSKDIFFLVAAHERALREALAAREFIGTLKDGKASDGRPLTITSWATAREVPSKDAGKTIVITPNIKSGEEAADYRPLDHPALRGWRWAGEDGEGNPIIVQGDMLVHPEIYRHLKNNLTKGAISNFSFEAGGRTWKPGAAALEVQRAIKHVILSFSRFHETTLETHALEHRTNPWNRVKLDMEDPNQRLLVDNGLMVAHYEGMDAFSEGLVGVGPLGKIPGIGPYMQAYSDHLFKDKLPELKMTTGLHALERNRKRYKGLYSDAKIAQITAKLMNAAFGGLNYRMLGRNRTLQEVFQLTTMAPDFLEARAKFVSQAFRPQGREQLIAYLTGAVALYTTARILNELSDGKPHWDKPFAVVNNGKEYSMRSVQEDTWTAVTSPGRFLHNRLSPPASFAQDFMEGRSRFGKSQTFGEQLKGAAQSNVPIPVQPWVRGGNDPAAERAFEMILKMVGVNVKTEKQEAQSPAMKKLMGGSKLTSPRLKRKLR